MKPRLSKEEIKANYKTHVTRFSDSSVYDEVCVNCGATDASGDERLYMPCAERLKWKAAIKDDAPLPF